MALLEAAAALRPIDACHVTSASHASLSLSIRSYGLCLSERDTTAYEAHHDAFSEWSRVLAEWVLSGG
jgi:hypothetical protein